MLFRNLLSVRDNKQIDISTEKDKIAYVVEHSSATEGIEFTDAIVFPGLINSHDHLDFNLFPRLGNRKYKNYVEWGDDIHAQNKTEIDKVLKVPKKLRVQWGMYKNLLNGFTTVVNHGPKLEVASNIVTIWQGSALHSVQLEKWWKVKLNLLKKQPIAIHIGEGMDELASKEIDELLKWNLLKKDVIGIHGIAINEIQAKGFKALVWCPDSNYFLIGKTAQIDKLKSKTNILFGTDSAVSSSWNHWEHLRLARKESMLSDTELFDALTVTPAKTWPIYQLGELKKGYLADIVVAKKKSDTGLESFYNVNPEDILLVMYQGKVNLFDENLRPKLGKDVDFTTYSRVLINGQSKYVVGNLPELIRETQSYYPEVKLRIEVA